MLRVSPATVLDDRISDAELALHLFVRNPHQFGGIILKGPGPVREAMVAFAQEALAKRGPVARIPVNIDSERLLGGLDLSATLAAGRGVMRSGLLNDCSGGVVILPSAFHATSQPTLHRPWMGESWRQFCSTIP